MVIGLVKLQKTMEHMGFIADLVRFIADLMKFIADLMGFIADLVRFIADLIDFCNDSMGYYWDIPSGKRLHSCRKSPFV